MRRCELITGVSVVIPAFNRTDPLRRAIESVTTAHPSTVEIVVVDDGSQDRKSVV